MNVFLILSMLCFAIGVVLFIYGIWTWIIQFNGDVYYHWAGLAVVAGAVFLVVGLFRHWRRA
ncbi:hypothetical protein PMI42_05064 [Bradyrhizobium sp. YR681]|nr:hypothetical protein PMI42_05064 [Bradyrhizobium sp. YR681]